MPKLTLGLAGVLGQRHQSGESLLGRLGGGWTATLRGQPEIKSGKGGVALPEGQHAQVSQGFRVARRQPLPQPNGTGDIAPLLGGGCQLPKRAGVAESGRPLPGGDGDSGVAERLMGVPKAEPAACLFWSQVGATSVGGDGGAPFLLQDADVTRQTVGPGSVGATALASA